MSQEYGVQNGDIHDNLAMYARAKYACENGNKEEGRELALKTLEHIYATGDLQSRMYLQPRLAELLGLESDAQYPKTIQSNPDGKPRLGLIADNRYMQPGRPKGRSVPSLLARYHDVVKGHQIIATQEVYKFLQNNGYSHHVQLPSRNQGGQPLMTNLIEDSTPPTYRVHYAISLTNPNSPLDGTPEHWSLIRSSVRNNAILLLTYKSAALFLSNETVVSSPKRFYSSRPEDETLALVAHPGMKTAMGEYITRHRKQIRRFSRIVTTGTTGVWTERFLRAVDVPNPQIERIVQKRKSGPEGGDIELAAMILCNEIDHVVFFIDPSAPHAHQDDIATLIRACRQDHVEVNLRMSTAAASSWIETVPAP